MLPPGFGFEGKDSTAHCVLLPGPPFLSGCGGQHLALSLEGEMPLQRAPRAGADALCRFGDAALLVCSSSSVGWWTSHWMPARCSYHISTRQCQVRWCGLEGVRRASTSPRGTWTTEGWQLPSIFLELCEGAAPSCWVSANSSAGREWPAEKPHRASRKGHWGRCLPLEILFCMWDSDISPSWWLNHANTLASEFISKQQG